MKNLVFVTGNPDKVRYLKLWLGLDVTHKAIDLAEIQSLDLKKVATAKAKQAYAQIGCPVLIEDVGLTFMALGALPGPLVKWFLQELAVDGMCRLLDGYTDRRATAEIIYVLYDGKKIRYFSAQTTGCIAQQPRGNYGFGWNAIFIPSGQTKTCAEMDDAELEQYSPRAHAITKLRKFLAQ